MQKPSLTFMTLVLVGPLLFPIQTRSASSQVAPTITSAKPDKHGVPKYERLELQIGLGSSYTNPFDPDEIDLSSEFTAPSGKKWKVNGFWNGTGFKVRFAGNEIGNWKYTVTAKDAGGTVTSAIDTFSIKASTHHGWIRIAPNKRYYRFDDGTAYHGRGLGYPWNVKETVLDSLKANGANSIVYWNSTYDWEGNGGGKYLIESIESGLGKYDLRKGERIDEIIEWLDAREMTMIFCIWPHAFLGDQINPTKKADGWEAFWDVNPYKNASKAQDFYDNVQSWNYQRKMYRYMLARWGYSQVIDHWWTVVEAPGTDGWSLRGATVVESWAQKVVDFFKLNDPFGHPTSGSQQGNEENYWPKGYQIFDLANREIYFNGSAYTSVVQETEKLWSQFQKPIIIGEIGNYVSPKTLHQDLWSALASGAASAPYWWNYPDKWSTEKWEHLRTYSAFVKDIPFGDMTNLQRVKPTVTGASAFAILSDRIGFGWIVNEGGTVSGKSLSVQGLTDGPYNLEWYDTWKGVALSNTKVTVTGGKITLVSPVSVQADIAFKLRSDLPTPISEPYVKSQPTPLKTAQALVLSGNLWVTAPSAQACHLSIVGLDGHEILSRELASGANLVLPLSGFKSGVHFLTLVWQSGSFHQKLLL